MEIQALCSSFNFHNFIVIQWLENAIKQIHDPFINFLQPYLIFLSLPEGIQVHKGLFDTGPTNLET